MQQALWKYADMARSIKKTAREHAQHGSILVEAVIAAAITLTTLMGAITTFSYLYRSAISNTANTQAAFLEEEGLEAVRILRDNGWTTNIASQTSGANVYLYWNGTTWTATSTNTFISGVFERKVIFADIYRDGNKNIVLSGGTLDTNTKKVTVFVSWSARGATTTRSLSTYLANVFNN